MSEEKVGLSEERVLVQNVRDDHAQSVVFLMTTASIRMKLHWRAIEHQELRQHIIWIRQVADA